MVLGGAWRWCTPPIHVVLCGLCLMFSSCGPPATQVLVHFDADPVSEKRAKFLQVRIRSQEDQVRLERRATLQGPSADLELPTRVPVSPKDGDASRVFRIEGTLLDQTGDPFSEQRAIVGFVEDTRFHVRLRFTDACIDRLDCAKDQTCREGRCVDARVLRPGQEQAFPSDDQPGACEGSVCWEHPRPAALSIFGACVAADGERYVVGAHGHAMRYAAEPGIWEKESTPVTRNLWDVACWSGGQAVAAGRTILARGEDGWRRDWSGDDLHLNAVWGASPDDVWAVGDGGRVLRRQGTGAWTEVDLGTTGELMGVWGSGPQDVYVTGAEGTVMHFDGTAWSSVMLPAQLGGDFGPVTGSGPDQLLAVHEGRIYEFDGTEWQQTLTASIGLSSIGADSSGLAAAGAGRGSLYLRPAGQEWRELEQGWGRSGELVHATAVAQGNVIWGGRSGIVGRWDADGGFREDIVRFGKRPLRAVDFDPDDDSHAVAVGAGGTVLERVAEGLWRGRVVGDGDSLVESELLGVWLGANGHVLVGRGGVIAESDDGRIWARVRAGTAADLHAVHGRSGRVVAVGDSATLRRNSDGQWSAFSPPLPSRELDLRSVWIGPDGVVWTGSEGGAVWRHDDSGWQSVGMLEAPVERITGLDASRIWAAAGPLYRWQNGSFVAVATEGVELAGTRLRDVGLGPEGPRWLVTDRMYVPDPDGEGWHVPPYGASMRAVGVEPVRERALGVGRHSRIVRF